MGKSLLNIHKDVEKKKHADLMERGNKFMEEYRELSRKHKIDLSAEIEYKPNGIFPVLRARPLEEPRMKPWSEAKRDNLNMRMLCEHEAVSETEEKEKVELTKCKKCNLHAVNWGEFTKESMESMDGSRAFLLKGKGVTEVYQKNVERQIEGIAATEKEEESEQS